MMLLSLRISPFSKKLTVRRILVSRGGGELADLDVANDGARGKRFCNGVRRRRVI